MSDLRACRNGGFCPGRYPPGSHLAEGNGCLHPGIDKCRYQEHRQSTRNVLYNRPDGRPVVTHPLNRSVHRLYGCLELLPCRHRCFGYVSDNLAYFRDTLCKCIADGRYFRDVEPWKVHVAEHIGCAHLILHLMHFVKRLQASGSSLFGHLQRTG